MSKDNFCKSQLITCTRVKECNGVCPFEDALKHADQTEDEQNEIEHDREWIIGCIKHDGFIKTDRFDKANQIILDALADRPKVAYVCDGRACDADCSECFRTTNIEHAKHFERLGDAYMEQTDRPMGEWIVHGEPPWLVRECSKCGTKWYQWSGDKIPNYCGECGAYMKGGDE